MFFKKKFKKIDERLFKLECPHPKSSQEFYLSTIYEGERFYNKICRRCGEILEISIPEKKHLEESINIREKELKELKKRLAIQSLST